MTKKIMITGGKGKLGTELRKVFPLAISPSREKLDITDRKSVFRLIKELKPDLLIHTAALTSIRECQSNKKLAWRTNVKGTENLVDACSQSCPEVYFIHMSTACVFDGEGGMYDENDILGPKNYYSFTKAISEFPPKKLKNHLIIRTNFVAKREWDYPKAFTDRYGTYLFADDVAMAMKEIIDKGLKGIVHITGEEKMSMFQLAKKVSADVKPITLKDYKGPPLTVDMSLDTVRWKKYKISEYRSDQ